MNAGPDRDFPLGGDELDTPDDAVWRLLAQAPRPEPDGWFAARTLARCRAEQQAAALFTRVRRWVLGGALGVSAAVTLLVSQVHPQPTDKQKNVQEAFEIMASIDNDSDSATSPSSSWQDSSL